jgi:hypothetical protein
MLSGYIINHLNSGHETVKAQSCKQKVEKTITVFAQVLGFEIQ